MASGSSTLEINWFKAGRKYIQAADLVGTAWQQVGNVASFEFASRKVADHPVRWVPAGSVAKDEVLATFNADTTDGDAVALVAVQDVARDITRMDEFAEEKMFAVCTIDGDRLDCPVLPDFSIWEHVSSLHKHLLGKIFGHPSWWFVRLEGNANMGAAAKTITIRHLEKKRILYRSEILINGEYAGMVDYALR